MFNFDPLDDLELTADEMRTITQIFAKQKVAQAFWNETPQLFIENFVRCLRVCPHVDPVGCVPSVVAAQGILESGWFSTRSLFGVKATKFQKENSQYANEPTHEIENGTSIPQVDAFFETPSLQNNFSNYFNYIKRMKPNAGQFLPSDALGYLLYLQKLPNAYSTAGSQYVNTVLSIIQSNGLRAFDHA